MAGEYEKISTFTCDEKEKSNSEQTRLWGNFLNLIKFMPKNLEQAS